ncbi:MAG: YvcK family protein [Desulfofustis sp.]|nr:YvcK family protein [Desulfofustis sp.]
MSEEFIIKNKILLTKLGTRQLAPLDLLSHHDLREKLVDLVLNDGPRLADLQSSTLFGELRQNLIEARTDDLRVVVFGGGTGLSNIIGGDCRQKAWANRPFEGLKQVFPQTTAVVCVTDDVGSTGELLKDVPVIAVGDIRHVLLSSIQLNRLQQRYDLNVAEATDLAGQLSALFNFRYTGRPGSVADLLGQCGAVFDDVPREIREYVTQGLNFCFTQESCLRALQRPHCLGNLIILSAICRRLPVAVLAGDPGEIAGRHGQLIYDALADCGALFGTAERAVMPCTATPAQLCFLYGDGVQVTGEKKSSEARRGFPVDRVRVDFSGRPFVPESLIEQIGAADILIMAPGSLYSSIIPVMQVPGIAAAVRNNNRALKLLIANLWVQDGETDRSNLDPERKFHVSDMIRAYDRNLPGGVRGLFDQVLCLSLHDIPGSVIQNYAVEGKSPIYLDREVLKNHGFAAIECGFYSKSALHERQVIQHDPHVVAQTVKTLYLAERLTSHKQREKHGTAVPVSREDQSAGRHTVCLPAVKYHLVRRRLFELPVTGRPAGVNRLDEDRIREELVEIIWYHQDIPLGHFATITGITCVDKDHWRRDQRWDNVFSFYEPEDGHVYIRRDRLDDPKKLEVAFLIAVGQALLGNYAREKRIEPLTCGGITVGSIYHLLLCPVAQRNCYFTDDELREFLALSRMNEVEPRHFTRVINGEEGFTPPGLLMGLMYAWYLDNRLASHIEYKMSILKMHQTDLIPEQIRMRERRVRLTAFFRQSVFGKEPRGIGEHPSAVQQGAV